MQQLRQAYGAIPALGFLEEGCKCTGAVRALQETHSGRLLSGLTALCFSVHTYSWG